MVDYYHIITSLDKHIDKGMKTHWIPLILTNSTTNCYIIWTYSTNLCSQYSTKTQISMFCFNYLTIQTYYSLLSPHLDTIKNYNYLPQDTHTHTHPLRNQDTPPPTGPRPPSTSPGHPSTPTGPRHPPTSPGHPSTPHRTSTLCYIPPT